MKCGIAARVSNLEQARPDKVSLENQLERAAEYAEAKGWTVTERYVEVGVSGAARVEDRPEIQRLFADAESGAVEVVVWWKFDRLSRSARTGLEIVNRLKDTGVAAFTVQENIDPNTKEGRMFRTQMLSFAEYEREVIAERMVNGRHGAAANGRWPGGQVPYGWKILTGISGVGSSGPGSGSKPSG